MNRKISVKRGKIWISGSMKASMRIEKRKSISPEEYESLIEDAREYAKMMGLDENDCYRIVEEFIASIK